MSTPTESGFGALQTGDILLFKGSAWYSRTLEWLGKAPYSHVGIVVKDPTYIGPELMGYYMLESGFGFGPDIEGKTRAGVQLNRLDDVLATYQPGQVYVRHLTVQRDARFYDTLRNLYLAHEHDNYDFDPFDWIEAKIRLDEDWKLTQCLFGWNDSRKTKAFWCSALVAFVYARLGLLEDPKDVPWTLVAPGELSSAGGKVLRFHNCSLADEIQLQWV